MKFVLEVDMDAESIAAAPAEELGRILRYWGGSLKQLELAPGATQDLYDSTYAKVGNWRIES
ncbi:hypothetical protein ASD65_11290 [Microbacterium sp. Root61]|uniref:hypothetical protein n=1 Tax=Microbacterium sp. Root61 TaxID=1736570 RepID=UPI0006F71CA3|nr:hypothetical protein [Microbacterium sp. Root61]KRA24948.1 hypothetical protein ASD65_11290 [Microbacterium sp. Root61]